MQQQWIFLRIPLWKIITLTYILVFLLSFLQFYLFLIANVRKIPNTFTRFIHAVLLISSIMGLLPSSNLGPAFTLHTALNPTFETIFCQIATGWALRDHALRLSKSMQWAQESIVCKDENHEVLVASHPSHPPSLSPQPPSLSSYNHNHTDININHFQRCCCHKMTHPKLILPPHAGYCTEIKHSFNP
jgi:hypothetical protein